MWRADGRGEAYVYHVNQPGKYGQSYRFPEDFRFTAGLPYRVRMTVKMNTPRTRNGTLDVWIASADEGETHVVSVPEMEWRTVPDFGVDSLLFNTLHGGSSAEWAPSADVWADFSSFSVTFP